MNDGRNVCFSVFNFSNNSLILHNFVQKGFVSEQWRHRNF